MTLAERWQPVSMSRYMNMRVAWQMGVHHAVIGRRVERLPATGMIGVRLRSGTSRKTTPREDRLIARNARINRFATSTRILDEVNFGGHVSVRTVDTRINGQHLGVRIPIQWPQLYVRHLLALWNWSRYHIHLNIGNWK